MDEPETVSHWLHFMRSHATAGWSDDYRCTLPIDYVREAVAAHDALTAEIAALRLEKDVARAIPTDDETVRYIGRYGGMCRDCADEDGVCPGSGLPCDGNACDRAIRHVIDALNYGHKHAYLPLAASKGVTPGDDNE